MSKQTKDKKAARRLLQLPEQHIFILLLTWTAGCVDAISFMRFTVFPANMTGNTVLIGISLGTAQMQRLLYSGTALLVYSLGVFIASLIIKGEGQRHPSTQPFSITMGIETCLILSIVLLQFLPQQFFPHTQSYSLLVIALSALTMGMQSATAHRFGVAGIATTYITGTITTMVMGAAEQSYARLVPDEREIASVSQERHHLAIQGSTWLIYVSAAAFAAVTETHIPAIATVLPLISSILVVAGALVKRPASAIDA
ncbi:MAG TPA: YoaK family protein [Ktedonobacteraceae bacterium]|jgi:uncharacterized membrane protein YoaK (UPF0700 family)|nr:YoaK family protein [Ktedonobacteraceae bacterium]